MAGKLVVGKGGEPQVLAQAPPAQAPTQASPPQGGAKTMHGVGVVIAALPRLGRLIVRHEEIKGFMAAMEMSYPVTSPAILRGLGPGDKIGFTIDPDKSTITAIEVTERAK